MAVQPGLISSRIREHSQEGQIVALFAVSILAMVALLGLIFDGGNMYVQRRTVQNSADAASLAGTRALLDPAAVTPDTTIAAAICTYLTANAFGTTPAVAVASFVDTAGTALLPAISTPVGCTGPITPTAIPPSAAGVQVTATIAFKTYLAGFVGFSDATAAGSSTVRGSTVKSWAADNAPFIICGLNTKLTSGANLAILSGSAGAYTLNSLAVGQTFLIHGNGGVTNNLASNSTVEQCGDTNWKGLADQAFNGGLHIENIDLATTPTNLTTGDGTGSYTTSTHVDGFSGCAAATLNCVMIIPIAVSTPGTNLKSCVMWAAFKITLNAGSGGRHFAKLLSGFSVGIGPEVFNWTWLNRKSMSLVSLGATE